MLVESLGSLCSLPGLEVIKLEFSLRLKIKHVRKQPIIALYFESENELKFYNLKARFDFKNAKRNAVPFVIINPEVSKRETQG